MVDIIDDHISGLEIDYTCSLIYIHTYIYIIITTTTIIVGGLFCYAILGVWYPWIKSLELELQL